MKRLLIAVSVLAAIFLGTFTIASAVSIFTVQQGGTGRGTFSSGELIYGNLTAGLSSTATTSATCSGGSTCNPFTVLGSSPVTISSSAPGLSTTTADYIVYNQDSNTVALKTTTNTVISSSASADVVLNAIVADAPTTGADIYVKPGTYYLNATTTFPGTTDLAGSTWKLQGSGQGTTNFVVNKSADAFYGSGPVKFLPSNFTVYLKDGARGFTCHNSSGFRCFWNSNFQNIAITGTTTLSTGWGFDMENDDHNIYSNIYITNIGNGFRSKTDTANLFNPGDATLSNIWVSFATPSGGAAHNTFQTGIAYSFDSSYAASTIVNQNSLINVGGFDPDGTRTFMYLNHAKNIHGVSVESEGFATTTEMYATSQFNTIDWEYVIGSAVTTNALFYMDSTSDGNTMGCTFVNSYSGTQPLLFDRNTNTGIPNTLQGVNGSPCTLNGAGTFSYSTTTASLVRDVHNSITGSEDTNNVKIAGDRLWFGFGDVNNVFAKAISNGLQFFTNNNSRITIQSNGQVGIGTTSPQTTLDVSANDTNNVITTGNIAAIRITNRDGTTVNNMEELSFVGNDSGGTGLRNSAIMGVNLNHTPGAMSGSMAFITRNAGTFSEKMRLDSNGNLGIGTTSPSGRLSIASVFSNTSPLFIISTSTAAATTTAFQIDPNGNVSVNNGASFTITSQPTGCATFTSGVLTSTGTACAPAISTPVSIANGGTATSTFYDGGVVFYNNTLGTLSQSGTVGNLYWDNTNSRLGIGTSSPFSRLSISNSATTPVNTSLFTVASTTAGTATSTLFTIDGAGHTTIGAAVNGGSAGAMLDVEAFATNTSGFGININNANVAFITAALQVKGITLFDSGAVTRTPMNVFGRAAQTAALLSVGSTTSDYTSTGNFLTVAANGNTGVGTTSPFAKLSVMVGGSFQSQAASTAFAIGSSTAGTATTTIFSVTSAGALSTVSYNTNASTGAYSVGGVTSLSRSGGDLLLNATGNAGAAIRFDIGGPTEAGRFEGTTGNLGLGTTSPFAKLSVAGAAGGTSSLFTISSSTSGFATSTAVIVDQNGQLGIATTSPWRTFDVNGTVGMKGLTGSSGLQTGILCLSATNEVINESVACVASAARYKEKVKDLTVGLDEVMKLRPVSFYWKQDFNGALKNDPNKSSVQYSLIADEVQKIDPNLVYVQTSTTTFEGKTYKPGTVEGIADSNHWAALFVKAFQDVVARLVGIDKRLDNQQQQINALSKRIKALEK